MQFIVLFWISSEISSWNYLEVCCWIVKYLEISLVSSVTNSWFGSIVVSELMLHDFSSFKPDEIYLLLFIYLPCSRFCGYWKLMYILMVVSGIFYKCWLDSIGGWVSLFCILPSFRVTVLSIGQKGGFESPTIVVNLGTFPFISVRFCFTCFSSLLFGYEHI